MTDPHILFPNTDRIHSLKQLSQGLGQLKADSDMELCGLCDDSREIKPGYAFLCMPRSSRYASEYAKTAEMNGAIAVICVGMQVQTDLPVLQLDSMQQLGLLLRRWFDTEQAKSNLIGVTGTDGKTSVTWMLRQALMRQLNAPVWSSGTLGWVRDDADIRDIGNTTPALLTMHALLATAEQQHINHIVSEISSHGIAQERITGLDFSAVVWTSMGHDHLQDHGGYENYLSTKAGFINDCARHGGQVIANADHDDICSRAPSGSHWYGRGLNRAGIDLAWEQELPGMVRLAHQGHEILIEDIPLGEFHAENIACVALTLMTALDVQFKDLPELLNGVSAPPGRMQDLAAGLWQVFIDYAHTPEALERCLHAARILTRRRLLLVFGCGGERDREKRPQMGETAAQLADLVWITSDNPRGELPEVIASEIEHGISRPYSADIRLQLDREQAMAEAIAELQAGDTLVIAGKGHEAYMEIAGTRLTWSDREVAEKYLASKELKACA